MPKGVYIRSEETKAKIRKSSIGRVPPSRKGVNLTEEHKRKISLKMKGKTNHLGYKMSNEAKQYHREIAIRLGLKPPSALGLKRSLKTRKRMSEVALSKKEKHHNWKGGITKFNNTKRNVHMKTFEYRNWRKNVFERDDYTCQICFVRGGDLRADHIKPYSLFPHLRLLLENGRTLCDRCHRNTDTYGTRLYKTYANLNIVRKETLNENKLNKKGGDTK